MHIQDINWWLLCLTNFPGTEFCFAQVAVAFTVAFPVYKLVRFMTGE